MIGGEQGFNVGEHGETVGGRKRVIEFVLHRDRGSIVAELGENLADEVGPKQGDVATGGVDSEVLICRMFCTSPTRERG